MQVYVVTINEVSDFEQFDHEPYVFLNLDDARKFLSGAKEEAISDYMEDSDEDMKIDKNKPDYFCLYSEAGGWSHTHYEVEITKCEVLGQ